LDARNPRAVVVELIATAASATPTLELSGAEWQGWKGAEVTVYRSSPPQAARPAGHDAAGAHPFTFNP
jgi:hypothetical protein